MDLPLISAIGLGITVPMLFFFPQMIKRIEKKKWQYFVAVSLTLAITGVWTIKAIFSDRFSKDLSIFLMLCVGLLTCLTHDRSNFKKNHRYSLAALIILMLSLIFLLPI